MCGFRVRAGGAAAGWFEEGSNLVDEDEESDARFVGEQDELEREVVEGYWEGIEKGEERG